MLRDKSTTDEGMRCTRIKQHNCRVIGNRKPTDHDGLPFWYIADSGVVDLPVLLDNLALLSMLLQCTVLLLLRSSRILLSILGIPLGLWALTRPVTKLATVVAGMVVGCLWSGDTNTWGVRLCGTLLVGIMGGGRGTDDHLLVGVR